MVGRRRRRRLLRFHFYVDETAPEEIKRHGQEHDSVSRFVVPSGTVWCCGVEYAARDPLVGHEGTPPGGLGKHDMGGKFLVEPGEYSLEIFKLDWPAAFIRARVRDRIGARASYFFSLLGFLYGSFLLGGVVTLVGLLYSHTVDWRAWAAAAGAVILGFAIAKWRIGSPADRARQAAKREYPAFAAELHRLNVLPS